MSNVLLDIRNLSVNFSTDEGTLYAVKQVDLSIKQGESIAVVGESGAGKSQIFQAVMGLLTANAQATGKISFKSKNLLNQPDSILNQLRGQHISMVFQDPMTSLNPYLTVGKQLVEVLQVHQKMSFKQAKINAIDMLKAVKLRNPERCFQQYPHELSGGMRQRIVIAMALLCSPDLLIADEPTTALDVTIQASIMALFKDFYLNNTMAMVLITHDLPLARIFCERIVVMYAGSIVESGKTSDILSHPQHPYTQALLAASPQNALNKHGRLQTIEGTLPDPLQPISTCSFYPRCHYADKQCQQIPALVTADNGHQLACFHPLPQGEST